MRYRVLGRTGLIVSEIGLGGHEYRLLKWGEEVGIGDIAATQPMRDEIIERAVKAGINHFDTTFIEEVILLGLR